MLVISGFSWLLAWSDPTVVFHILSGKGGKGPFTKAGWVPEGIEKEKFPTSIRRRVYHKRGGQMTPDQGEVVGG